MLRVAGRERCGRAWWWPVSVVSEGGWGRVESVVVLGQQESTIFWRRGRHWILCVLEQRKACGRWGQWVWWRSPSPLTHTPPHSPPTTMFPPPLLQHTHCPHQGVGSGEGAEGRWWAVSRRSAGGGAVVRERCGWGR